MKFKLFFLFFGALTFSVLPQDNQYYQIQSQSATGLKISFRFEELNITETSAQSQHIKSFEIPNLPLNYEDGKAVLPILTIPLVLPDSKVSINASVEKSTRLDGIFPPVFKDISNQADRAAAGSPLAAFTEQYPDRFYEIKDLGLFRDYRIAALRIYPVQVTGSGMVFYKEFDVSISFPDQRSGPFAINTSETELLKKIVKNQTQANLISPLQQNYQPAPYSPRNVSTDSRVKLVVDKDGIYQVTGNDLQNAEINISQITPSSFRLTNKGKQVALYIVGDQDNSFDPGDYVEFWGEANRQTFQDQYSDQYTDPFSDENVYWLEWGGSAGLRMVEENGSLVTNDPREFNRSPFYAHKVHVENNSRFERLGSANLDKLSYTRDLWFFDSGIKAVGRKQYTFQIMYPDSTSLFNPVFVDVMLSGKSLEGGHDVAAWLNDDIIGHSDPTWKGQDTSRITNRPNSPMRSFDLAHGNNQFEIQLPTPVQTGTDIVLLNWFEVTYDRQYRAYENYIEFTRPSLISFPNINLFQFDIERFTRPDIEIYKKDISKIVNFDIQLEVGNSGNFYNVSFQDHILSADVEYVALTANQKKKPLRIESDKPFDPDNPQKRLKDPSNSADYLIITHSRLYDNALQLRDFRRSQGLDVELVKVQDIYDEFNYGIKSPLAVKAFLKYAYRNWNPNHKLKYVLLLGDGNYDYKSTGVHADLVPAFFYQSIEFGAVATDYPYSLISGDDLIPDIFVGRIPATTNSDIIVVTEKIIEYEQSAPVGQWRNQALFISGNDSKTLDRYDNNRPMFRAQNSRILEDQLPDYISSFRLNVIRDTALTPDPNFGSTTDLIEYFDDGISMVNFFGHGGGGIWADVTLMNRTDVNRLNNQGKYPFITSMTCFTGAFDNPGEFGLAQKLVLTANKGAIGVLASSGLGWAYNDFSMLWTVGQFLLREPIPVGEAITLGKIYYLSSISNYYVNDYLFPTPQHETGNYLGDDMVHQYNLIGDPYIQIARSPEELKLSLTDNNPQSGDTLEVTIQSPFAPAEGYVEIADNENNIVNRLPVFTSDFSSTIILPIPATYPEGTGIVRAYLSNDVQDANGFTRIGVNYAAIDSISIIPQNPDADDSVHISFRVMDKQGIQRVYLLEQNNFSDTLFAQEVQPGVYRTVQPFPPIFKVGTVFYSIYVENNQGSKSIFRNLKYVVSDQRPDVFVYSNSMDFTGRERVQLRVRLGNTGGSTGQSTPVYFYDGFSNFKNQISFANGTVDVTPGDSTELRIDFPLDLSLSGFNIYVKVDPQNQIQDFNRQNNVDSSFIQPAIFNVTPALGSTYSNNSNDTLSTDPAYRIFFPPGSVDQPTALKLALKEFQPPADQPGLIPLSIKNQSEYHGVEVKLLNPDVQIIAPFILQMDLRNDTLLNNSYDFGNVKLYQKSSTGQPWLFIESSVDSITEVIQTNASKSSFYSPFVSSDDTEPRIELTVNGRPIQRRAQISSKPVMYVVVEDESGLDFTRDNIHILMDNQPLSDEKVFIPDSTNRKNILGITVYPQFDPGEHRLTIQISDVNGNISEKEWELVVSDEFDVHVYGNYPNPFTDHTIFSYFVTPDVLDEFEIRIYTVSGRLIKRITDDENTANDPRGFGARNVGYNELIWDGTDEGGVKVANGVYFALIRAKYQDETIEEILKVAKLR